TRMLDLGVPACLLHVTLLGIMAQRLVRILCPHCKQAHPLMPEQEAIWDHLVTPWKAPRPARIHRAVGCIECRMTGYMGRIGLYEILLMSPEVRRLVGGNVDIARVRDLAIREGMKPLRLSGALKVAAGITTLEEVVKVAPPAENEEAR
ncbi:MAG: type II/IV secretion system protein, partial [Proteobacteria bacterium]|nr:type II/IV secretion system protein [Pseudomonadota bacterium]